MLSPRLLIQGARRLHGEIDFDRSRLLATYAVLGEDTGIGVFCISVVKDKDK